MEMEDFIGFANMMPNYAAMSGVFGGQKVLLGVILLAARGNLFLSRPFGQKSFFN